MPILNDIAHQINLSMNNTLFSKSKRFIGARLFDICESSIKTGQQKQEYPTVTDLNGSGVYAGIDETHSLIIYHRKQGVRLTEDTVNKGYGDNTAPYLNLYSMSLVAFMNKKRLGMESDELALYLQKHLPAEVFNKNFHYLSITIDSVILNPQQVFQREYINTEYFLKPEHALIALSYTIEGKPIMACFNSCPD